MSYPLIGHFNVALSLMHDELKTLGFGGSAQEMQ